MFREKESKSFNYVAMSSIPVLSVKSVKGKSLGNTHDSFQVACDPAFEIKNGAKSGCNENRFVDS